MEHETGAGLKQTCKDTLNHLAMEILAKGFPPDSLGEWRKDFIT